MSITGLRNASLFALVVLTYCAGPPIAPASEEAMVEAVPVQTPEKKEVVPTATTEPDLPAASDAELKAMVDNVIDYPTKFKLIRIGLPAAPLLFEKLTSDDERIVLEARSALRWIAQGTSETPEQQRAAIELLRDKLSDLHPMAQRQFAAYLLGFVGGKSAAQAAAGVLQGKHPDELKLAAAGSLRLIQHPSTTPLLMKALETTKPELQVFLLEALGDRGDPKTAPALMHHYELGDVDVEIAAIQALGHITDPNVAATTIAKIAHSEATRARVSPPSIAQALGEAEVNIGRTYLAAKQTKKAIALFNTALGHGNPRSALNALGKTQHSDAAPLIKKHLTHDDSTVRVAAFNAYLNLADAFRMDGKSDLAFALYAEVLDAPQNEWFHSMRVIRQYGLSKRADTVKKIAPFLSPKHKRLNTFSTLQREHLWRTSALALHQAGGAEARETLVAALTGMSLPLRVVLLEVVAGVGDRSMNPVILKMATEGADEGVMNKAIWTLGQLGGDTVDETLVGILAKAKGAKKQAVLDALVQMGRNHLAGGATDKALAAFHTVLDHEPATDTHIAAIRGVGKVGRGASLKYVEPLLDSTEEEGLPYAVEAALPIADDLATSGKRKDAARIYRKLMAIGGDDPEKFNARLRSVNEQVEYDATNGILNEWWLLGPFPAPTLETWTKSYAPEKSIDLKESHTADGRALAWAALQTKERDGTVELHKILEPRNKVAAYLYAEILVDRDQAAVFHLKYDDGGLFWLNGQKIYSVLKPHAMKPEEEPETLNVQLRKGSNPILVKLCQVAGHWKLALKITDPQGKPLAYRMR